MSKKINPLPTALTYFIFHFVKQQSAGFGGLLLSSIFIALIDACYPYFIKVLIDRMEKLTPPVDGLFHLLTFPLTALLLSWFSMEMMERFQGTLSIYIWPKFRKNIRKYLFSYTQGHSHNYFTEHFTGELANKIAELPRACEHILAIILHNSCYIMISFSASLIIVSQVSIIFGLFILGFLTITILIISLNIKNINQTVQTHAEAVFRLDGRIVDSLGAMLAVRLFARTDYELNYLTKYQTDEIQKSQQAAWVIWKCHAYRATMTCMLMACTFYLLMDKWNHGQISLGDVSLIGLSFFHLMMIAWHSIFHTVQIAKEIGISKAALSILNEPHGVVDHPDAKPSLVSKGSITFDHVSFHYTPGIHVFNQLSIQIEGGQKIGLVGFSGSGKTTFINLLLRLYDLQNGKILIDNQDIAYITQASLHEQIAVIPQDPSLFHRTVYENIHYGCLDTTKEAVWKAAGLANCHEFIQQLDNGIETMVGEGGVKLSGGQRQRIAIARAIVKDAPILIMDEATAALDSVTEKLIQDSLNNLMQNKTTLVIAHRLSTLQHMDRILVFHQGVITEDGTLSELLAKKGHFSKLWEMQTHGFFPF